MDVRKMRETLSVGKAADEENSTAGVTSGYNRGHEIQHRRWAEFIVHLIILSILAGLIYYYARFGGGQAEKPENTTIVIINVKIVTPITQATTPATGTHHYDLQQNLVTTPVPQILYEECGGMVYVPRNETVYIAYKNRSNYGHNERCLWVISSEATQVILKFRDPGHLDRTISRREDGFIVAQMDTSGQELTCKKWATDDYYKTKYLSVPSFLHFTSNQASYVSGLRSGFVMSLTTVEKQINSLNHLVWPSISFVRSRKRGVMNLYQNHQSPFGVFYTSRNHGISKRNFTCTRSVKGKATEISCCDSVEGYEIKKYSDGEYCVHAAEFGHGNRSVVTENSFVVFLSPRGGVKNTSCQLAWTE